MSSAVTPPRFVPTLTEVVYPASMSLLPEPEEATAVASSSNDVSLQQFEDQLLHRVMQRVDLVLERRLRDAVSQIILTQTQALGPRLREEIERVVRNSVTQAIAQELPHSVARD